jgi:hypothetical protein
MTVGYLWCLVEGRVRDVESSLVLVGLKWKETTVVQYPHHRPDWRKTDRAAENAKLNADGALVFDAVG